VPFDLVDKSDADDGGTAGDDVVHDDRGAIRLAVRVAVNE